MTTTTEAYVSTEAESREVAEQARQAEWEGKGFLRDLFLGKLQLDLIHPFPRTREERPAFQKFAAELERFLVDQVDPAAIDETGEYPPHVVDGLRKLGAFGMKIPKEYGGLGFTVAEYCAVMEMVGSYDSNIARAPLRPSVDRRAPAAQALRHARAEEEIPAALRRRRHLGLRAHRAARRLRSGQPDHDGGRGTATSTSSTARSSGAPTARWPSCSW